MPEAVTGASLWIGPFAILVRATGLASCLYNGRAGGLLGLTLVERSRTQYRPGSITMSSTEDAWSSITKLEGVPACPTEPRITGSLTLEGMEIVAQTPEVWPLRVENDNIEFLGMATHNYIFENTLRTPLPQFVATLMLFGNRGFSVTRDGCNRATLAERARCEVEVTYSGRGVPPIVDAIRPNDGRSVYGAAGVRGR